MKNRKYPMPIHTLTPEEELATWPAGEAGKLRRAFQKEQHALWNYARAMRAHCPHGNRGGTNIWRTQGKGRRRVFYWFRQAVKWQTRGIMLIDRNTRVDDDPFLSKQMASIKIPA